MSPLGQESLLLSNGVRQVAHAHQLRWKVERQSWGRANLATFSIADMEAQYQRN
jgi:hypothetical protein